MSEPRLTASELEDIKSAANWIVASVGEPPVSDDDWDDGHSEIWHLDQILIKFGAERSTYQ